MSKWREVSEEGQVYYINDEVGNVMKLSDTMYISLLPKVVKLGPFKNLEDAKNALETCKDALGKVLDTFNESLMK